MFKPLHSILNQKLFKKHLCNPHIPKKRKEKEFPSYINYRLKSEVSIMLRSWLCSTRYTAARIKNCLKSTYTIKITTMKNTDDFRYEKSHHMLLPNRNFSLSAKMNGTQRKTLVRKSMKNALYILRYAKRCLLDQSNVKK